jgi:hypothetical protein
MGMSDKMRKEMMLKRDFVNALAEILKADDKDVFVTGDGAFAVIMEVDGVDRVLNFAGTMKKNLIEGVEATAIEVVETMVAEYEDKVADREKREAEAKAKKEAKVAEAKAKKAKKEAEAEAGKKLDELEEKGE